MFNFQNPVSSQPFAVPAGLSRLLLLCRFDYRQKSWELPAWEVRRDRDSKFSADAKILASAVSKIIFDFSDPSLGGANPSQTAQRRIKIRRSLRRSLGKTKTTKRKEI
jgi:hypothetical protein